MTKEKMDETDDGIVSLCLFPVDGIYLLLVLYLDGVCNHGMLPLFPLWLEY